jgi:bifunctional non-homologous end joining protein LigD
LKVKKTSAKDKQASGSFDKSADDNLELYRRKRNPALTNEPFSAERPRRSGETRSGRFVVHLHDATRTHYDLRLQFGGTLKSFAVPKGPSLDPDDKRLAVQTEDHPLEYLDFEAVIPAGNYGAGAMIAWDIGRVRYLEGSAEAGVLRGKIDFELHGFKLHGRYGLIHTGKRPQASSSREWLLVKKPDAFAARDRDILAEQPRSVLSGLTIEELDRKTEIATRLRAEAAAEGAPSATDELGAFSPMLCSGSEVELDDPERLYELKLDGVRMIADKRGEAVLLRYRNGRAASATYPEIARAVQTLAPDQVVLDGEVVALDEHGKPSFQRLGRRIHAARPFDVLHVQAEVPVLYMVFDVLALGDCDLRGLPLRVRKSLLERLIQGRGYLRVLDAIAGRGDALLDFCKENGLEGIVAKRASSTYQPGVSEDWVKIKCAREDDLVVVGYVSGKGSRQSLGALDLASYSGPRLRVRGKVGSGIDERSIAELLRRLTPLEQDAPAAEGELTRERERRFTRPELVVRVEHMGLTQDGRLRQAVFKGIRDGVSPAECTLESEAELTGAPEMGVTEPVASGVAERDVPAISNPDKVFWPAEGYTKRDLCEYYAAVAPFMLPFLRGRPVVLVRYPDGVSGKNFYQWRAPEGTPSWIRRLELRDEERAARGDSKCVFLLDNVDGLVHVANLGCIPIHVLASTERSLDECDFLTIDLDIGEQPFKSAVILALTLRELLDEVGLVGFPKTSGQKGLHVLIPLLPGVSFDAAKLLVELLGRLLVARHPQLATMERRISKRGPKVYVDTGQTGRSRTIVAPYSVRAHPGATVSTPLSWDELHVGLDPTRFTLSSVPSRLAELGDPMESMLAEAREVAKAVRRLESKLKSS